MAPYDIGAKDDSNINEPSTDDLCQAGIKDTFEVLSMILLTERAHARAEFILRDDGMKRVLAKKMKKIIPSTDL
ncbi:hypothetical protein GW17_00001382 [Ensete ventricosum]|nr:hypothetical protein GW17_00001382 [Ensete ventricosum]RZS14368.1 hypothetical protein BHM03_00046089 [Ensete ventricosum]